MARREGRLMFRWRIARLILGKRFDWASALFARDVLYAPISKMIYERDLREGTRFNGWIQAHDLGDGRVDLIFTRESELADVNPGFIEAVRRGDPEALRVADTIRVARESKDG